MPNPFTKAIAARLQSRKLSAFIADWDALEALAIRVFRGKAALPADAAEHEAVRARLLSSYTDMQTLLDPHWRTATINREPVTADPFAYLLTLEQADAFLGNWAAMQNLPAAREALNHLALAAASGQTGAAS